MPAPIDPARPSDHPGRLRQITPARLAVQATASAGSGLIDLDEVARALIHEPPEHATRLATRLLPARPEALVEAVVLPSPAAAATRRTLVLTTLALLAVLAAMLAFVALT